MANKKITDYTALTSPADGDLVEIVDISDTTDAATGTNKKITHLNLVPEATDAVKGKVELATTAETTTGTDATRAVTPDGLHDMTSLSGAAWFLDEDTMSSNSDTKVPSQQSVKAYVDTEIAANPSGNTAPTNLLKNGNFINNSTNGYGSTPDDWVSSNANPVQGGIPALTKQDLIDILGVTDAQIEAFYNLNGNLNDLSANGYNLTASGSAPTDSSDGLMAQAKDFESGSSQNGSNATPTNAQIVGNQTFFALIKPESLHDGDCITVSDSGSNTVAVRLSSSGTIGVHVTGLTPNILSSDVKYEAGKWYLVLGIWDSSNTTLKIWINGIKKQQTGITGTHTAAGTLYVGGRTGVFYDGLVNCAGILSVALTDNQVKKLFAMTMYKGQKIRRATTNAYQYQQLPQDLVERLRGKTVALRADLYQDTASTAQISIHQTMADGTTDETIISATDATTGSWLSKVATGTLEADVVTVEIRIKHSTSDGNTWFKNVSLYEGSTLLPYDHSKDDWSRFPRLLKMEIPSFNIGYPYQYEENRYYDNSPIITSGSGTPTTVTKNDYAWMFSGKTCHLTSDHTVTAKGTAASTFIVPLPVKHAGAGISSATGRESGATGKIFGGNIGSTGVSISLLDYLNATLWVDTYRMPFFISYEID